MTVGAVLAAIVPFVFFHGVIDIDNAYTIVAGAFLLSHIWHWISPFLGFIDVSVIVQEKMFDHDRQYGFHTRVRHGIKHLFAASL